MSRVLAQLMGAPEPAFRTQLMRLEHAAGRPGADIKLMMEIISETRSRVRELGLDPHDTTGPELYEALKARLLQDEIRVRASLNIRADGTPFAVLDAVKTYLSKVNVPTQTFVVKQTRMRTILRKLRPKATAKYLGYRSMDSMLKHEPVAQLLAAASIAESAEWQQKRFDEYKKLKSTDFEVRKISYLLPTNKQWPHIAAEYTEKNRHNLLVIPELGVVIILPVEHDLPGLAITTLLLTVDAINEMRSLGSYLKLQQVKTDFGENFTQALEHEPLTAAELAGEQLPWKTVQWFYGRGHSSILPDTFEPYVQSEDLSWYDAESVLSNIHKALEFWEGSQLLALLDAKGQTVSLNMLDVALSVCNGLSFSDRVVRNVRMGLGRELLARYLNQENLQDLLLGKLDDQLIPEFATE